MQRHDRGGGRFRISVFIPYLPGIAGQIGYKNSLSTGQLCPRPGAPPIVQTAEADMIIRIFCFAYLTVKWQGVELCILCDHLTILLEIIPRI